MLQLLSTPTATMPASPPTSPALQHNASLPAPTSTTTSGASTTFAEPASWRPYHSHLARVIMTLPGLHAAGDDAPKKQRRMSFSFGAADGGAAADKEYVLEATVSIFADKMDILVSSDSTAPFVRPAGTNAANKPTGGSAHAPMSPPASPETRRKRLSFVNSLPGAGLFFGGNKDREHADGGGHDDSALDLEEHPEMGPGGIRQLRMKTAAAAAAPAPTAAPGSTFAEGTSGADAAAMPEERPHLEADEAKWPLFVNGAPLAQISIPLNQLSYAAVGMTPSRALSTEKAVSALAGTLNRSPATFTVHVPATEGASAGASHAGKDVYDGAVDVRVEFPSAFSGDTEAQTLLQIVELALDRLGVKPAAAEDGAGGGALKLTRTISRGLTGAGRRKSSFGEHGAGTDKAAVVGAGSTDAEDRAKAEYYDAMRYQ